MATKYAGNVHANAKPEGRFTTEPRVVQVNPHYVSLFPVRFERRRVWEEHGRRVKTDRLNALWMLNALDRFCAGNTKALALVRVPTQEEERQRSHSRLRQSRRRSHRVHGV